LAAGLEPVDDHESAVFVRIDGSWPRGDTGCEHGVAAAKRSRVHVGSGNWSTVGVDYAALDTTSGVPELEVHGPNTARSCGERIWTEECRWQETSKASTDRHRGHDVLELERAVRGGPGQELAIGPHVEAIEPHLRAGDGIPSSIHDVSLDVLAWWKRMLDRPRFANDDFCPERVAPVELDLQLTGAQRVESSDSLIVRARREALLARQR